MSIVSFGERLMTDYTRSERQARLVAKKLAAGQVRVTTWIDGALLEQLRKAYPTKMHGAADWPRIAEAALKLAGEQPTGETP
jgi:hypothetical protein